MTDVEKIKSKIDIVDFLSEYITLKKTGRNFKAICPFHNEKTPSFIVSPERQSWHCFGACNEGGDIVSFLQKWEGIEFLEALKILAKRAGVTLSRYIPSETAKIKDKIYEINHLASEFFHYLLTSHKLGEKAREYLKTRNIKPKTSEIFMLGYAPDSWDSLLNFLIKKGYEKENIYTAGLLVKSERGVYYDRFRGRLMFTLRDSRGNVVGFSGRKLLSSDKEAKYINTQETPVYVKGNTLYGLEVTKEAIKKTKEAIIVEGEFDLLSSFQIGVSNVVAIKGSALTEGQIILLKRYTENVILALDSDFAGSEAARRGLETAEKSGLIVRVARIPFGKDPAECIEKDPKLWFDAVRKTVPVYDFIIENAISKYGKKDALSKQKISAETIPFLAKIENPIILSHYIKNLAKLLDVTEESVAEAIRVFQKKQQFSTAKVEAVLSDKRQRDVLVEEYLLALILQSEKIEDSLNVVFSILEKDDFYQVVCKKIIELLLAYSKNHKKIEINYFSKIISPELINAFNKFYMMDLEKIQRNQESFAKELRNTALELKKISLRKKVNDLSKKIRQIEDEGKEAKAEDYSIQLKKLLDSIKDLDKSA